jgi:hypothetical protein
MGKIMLNFVFWYLLIGLIHTAIANITNATRLRIKILIMKALLGRFKTYRIVVFSAIVGVMIWPLILPINLYIVYKLLKKVITGDKK